VTLCMRFDSCETCEAVRRALEVDNVELPDCVDRIEMACSGDTLHIVVTGKVIESQDLLTIWSTLDDIMRCVKASIEALREAEKKRI